MARWSPCLTTYLLSIERAHWPKPHDMFKARDAKAWQRNFPVEFPVKVCASNLLLINIFQSNKTCFTTEFHDFWCTGNARDQAISIYGIDPLLQLLWSILASAQERLRCALIQNRNDAVVKDHFFIAQSKACNALDIKQSCIKPLIYLYIP